LPVLTWLLQKGRANCCSFIIPVRYWLVELFVGIIFAYFTFLYAQDFDLVALFFRIIFSWLMITVAVIDYETMIIPDRFSVGGAIIGLFLSFIFPEIHLDDFSLSWNSHFAGGMHALIGLFVGSALLYWIGAFAQIAFGRDALGEGDIKLLGCIGAFCGWKGAIFTIFGGAMLGTILLIPLMVIQKVFFRKVVVEKEENLNWGAEVPFGPYLAIAGLLYFAAGVSSYVDPWFDPILWFFDDTFLQGSF
jgi:leader peptidase (prepilin peptidase)/N-methyltransferase